MFREYLERVNPYVRSFRSTTEQVPNNATLFAIELTVPPTGGVGYIDPRKVVIFGRTNPQEVPVLSPYYEPLQYPLLFPHGTTGWGHNEYGRLLLYT
jgi:hypothetical protein